MWQRCDLDAISTWYWCYTDVISMWCRCDIDAIPVWYVFDTDDISMMRYRCDADVITCDIDVMPVWYSCDADVISLLLLWYRCDTDVIHMWYRCGLLCCCDADVIPMQFRCDYTVSSMTSMCGPMLRHVEPPAPTTSLSPVGWSYRYIHTYTRAHTYIPIRPPDGW